MSKNNFNSKTSLIHLCHRSIHICCCNWRNSDVEMLGFNNLEFIKLRLQPEKMTSFVVRQWRLQHNSTCPRRHLTAAFKNCLRRWSFMTLLLTTTLKQLNWYSFTYFSWSIFGYTFQVVSICHGLTKYFYLFFAYFFFNKKK